MNFNSQNKQFARGSGLTWWVFAVGVAALPRNAGAEQTSEPSAKQPLALANAPSGEQSAEPSEPSPPQAADEVVVTAARRSRPLNAIPNTVKVLNRAAVEQQLAVSTSVLDGLSFAIPSMTPGNQKLTSSGVTLRGRTPLYLVDGIPQSTPLRNGERSGFTLDPAFVDRVEVIYGANAMQGVGATGGIIQWVTPSAEGLDGPLLRVTSSVVTDEFERDAFHYRTAGLFGTTLGNAEAVVGAAVDKHGLFYDGKDRAVGIDAIQGDLADSLSVNLFGKLGYRLTREQRLQLTANYYQVHGDGDYINAPGNRALGFTASSTQGESELDPTHNRALNLALSYEHRDLFGGALKVSGYHYNFRALYGGGTFAVFQDPTIGAEGELYDQSALLSQKFGAQAGYVRENAFWPGLQVAGGLDYLRDETEQQLAQTDRSWVPPMRFTGWAPYLQLEQALMEEVVRVSGGVRWENVELNVPTFTTLASANATTVQGGRPTFDKWLGNVGVVVEPVPGLTAYGSWAQGFTMPDAGLILRAVNTPDQSVQQLVDLQPVVADNREVGVSYRSGEVDVVGSYFWSNSDLGSRIEVIDGAGTISRQRTEISGFELSSSYRWYGPGVEVGMAYARLNGRMDSDADGEVDQDLSGRNISPDRLNLYAEVGQFSWLSGRVQASTFFDRNFDGGAPEFQFNGMSLVDAMVTLQTETAGNFRLGIQNLFDVFYPTYFSQTVTFVADNNYYSGRGRSTSLTWTLQNDW